MRWSWMKTTRTKRFILVLEAFVGKSFDRDRTRTCNPQIRSLMPYPLGHAAADEEGFKSAKDKER